MSNGGEPGADGGEHAQVPYHAPHDVRLAAAIEVLRIHGGVRPTIMASPGHPRYEIGLHAHCPGCEWTGTSQVASGLPMDEHRPLAQAEAEAHLAEKILERLG